MNNQISRRGFHTGDSVDYEEMILSYFAHVSVLKLTPNLGKHSHRHLKLSYDACVLCGVAEYVIGILYLDVLGMLKLNLPQLAWPKGGRQL